MFGAHYLENVWRQRLDDNGAPIGNDYLGIKWSRDLKGQGRDPIHLEANISETAGDRDLVTMEHLQEMDTWESNSYVTDDVT